MQNSQTGGSVPAGAELGLFGKYHLIASLGQGGMANVFLALMAGPSGFNKLLVIKIMRQDLLAGSEETMRMFMTEARLAARLVHPNIVHTYEVGEHDGRYYLAMEYLDGQPLSTVLNRARGEREIPLAEYLRAISEIARGLHHAHQLRDFQGDPLDVVHRDVSPQNVIVTYDGQVKLLDFGIAKTSDAEHLTQAGTIKGKLDYIAPEQLRSDEIDGRADIFALGAMLWEVISGHRFAGGRKVSDINKMQARLTAGERKLSSLRPDVPPSLEWIVERAVALEPGARFPDAAQLADAIDAHLEEMGLRASARSLANHMCNLFEHERADMQKLIDEQVQRMKGDSLPPERELSLESRRPSSKLGLYLADQHVDERSSIRSMLAAPAAMSTPAAPFHSYSLLGALGALLAVACGAGLMWFLVARADHPVVSRPAPLPTAALAPERVEAAPERPVSPAPNRVDTTVSLRVGIEPAQAQVSLDGVPLSLPFTGNFQRDGALHRLEASADGYRPLRQFVAFDEDRALALQLERVPRKGSLDRPGERAEPSAVLESVKKSPREDKKRAPAESVRPNPYDD
jgi:eukaryotic-like serine/threonine-protein kinase